MRVLESSPYPTFGRTARFGAGFALRLTFIYALAFIGYAIVRAVVQLSGTPTFDGGWVSTLLAYVVTLALPALVIAGFMALVTVVLGTLTAVIVRALLSKLNPQHTPLTAALIGVVVALILAVLLHVGLGLSPDALTWETYLFWVGIPCVIYAIAGGVGSWRLCTRSSRADS